jgi:hypothetical protein
VIPERRQRAARIGREYLRAMRFVYEKEFVAGRAASSAAAVAELYRSRGLSTDTAVEAGYLVYIGLGILKGLEPDRRIQRVLIVGPGLDLAPRTGFLEASAPESYQPWAVIDALLTLGLARIDDLVVVGADVNPRVVAHLRRAHSQPPALTLVTGIAESDTVQLSAEYRSYFAALGRSIEKEVAGGTAAGMTAAATPSRDGHLRKFVQVSAVAASALRAETLNIVTERFDGAAYDLIIATNVLPYFDDAQLLLAMSNVAAMLAPGGVFLHNEPRPLLGDATERLFLPFEQSRHGTIATVAGAPAPLTDSVWLHRKRSAAAR